MYIPPRPTLAEDPFFAVRVAAMAVLALLVTDITQPSMLAICVVIPVTVMAGNRLAYQPMQSLISSIVVMVLISLYTVIAVQTRMLPVMMFSLFFIIFTLGFYFTRRTGSPLGMLIILLSALTSVIAMKGIDNVFYLRDSTIQATLISLIGTPLLYALFPAKTLESHTPVETPADDFFVHGALIRATVLMLLCFWLYAVLPASDIMMAVAAIFVLMFPTRDAAMEEAASRNFATIYGAIATGVFLFLVSYNAHMFWMLGLAFLFGWYFSQKMITGHRPAVVYQYAFSVMLSLSCSVLTTQAPGAAMITRIITTLTGALAAVYLTYLLESLLLPNTPTANAKANN